MNSGVKPEEAVTSVTSALLALLSCLYICLRLISTAPLPSHLPAISRFSLLYLAPKLTPTHVILSRSLFNHFFLQRYPENSLSIYSNITPCPQKPIRLFPTRSFSISSFQKDCIILTKQTPVSEETCATLTVQVPIIILFTGPSFPNTWSFHKCLTPYILS